MLLNVWLLFAWWLAALSHIGALSSAKTGAFTSRQVENLHASSTASFGNLHYRFFESFS